MVAGNLKIWRPSDLDSLELRVGTSFEHPYPRHWHEELFVSAITAGAGNFFFGGGNHLASPGTLVVVAPGEVHAHSDREGGRSFRSLSVPSCFVGLADFPSRVISDARIFQVFLRLHRALEGSGPRLHRESLLLGFFAELIGRVREGDLVPSGVGREYRAVRRAQEFLNEHYDRNVSLRELASVANLSPFYFHRVFCREAGMPPHAYLVQIRLLRAKDLLRRGRPIAHVALATGFADQSHFTRHFKRLMGVTPTQYAGQGKNVQDVSPQPR
jgi:AraC-like DNA-binding protein